MQFRNYRFIQYISLILCLFLVSCEKGDVKPLPTRTLMVYLAGDNELSGYMQKNIDAMMSAWEESYNANIVIYPMPVMPCLNCSRLRWREKRL